MANISAPRDNNRIAVISGTSSSDGVTPVLPWVDPITHRLLVDAGGTGGGGLTGTTGQYKTFVTVGTANADYLIGSYIDLGDAVNAAYAGLPATGGLIVVLAGTYSFLTPIVFGTLNKFVTFKGLSAAATFLKYTPTSGNAITINYGNPTGHLVSEFSGFTLMGKSTLIAAGGVNANTSIGIFYGGNQGAVGINTHDMNVNGFGSNWEISANAYMLQYNNCANSGGNGGQATRGALVHIDAANNSGERNVFNGCAFTDPGNSLATNAIYITQAGTASNFFTSNSFDDVQVFVAASNGQTVLNNNHWENSAFGTYPQYIPVLGANSDRSTMITFNGNSIANDGTNSGNTFQTIIKHGGQLVAIGTIINNYGGATITNFVDHSLDNGVASDLVGMIQVQGGGLTNIIAGSGGVPYTLANGACFVQNVGNSYTIGMRAQASNTNEFFSGSNVVGTFDHTGNWKVGLDTGSTVTIPGTALVHNFNTVLDASQFTGSDIGAKVNAAYAYITTLGLKSAIITMPSGIQTFSTPIVFGTDGVRVSLRGTPGGGTELDYTGSVSTVAITVNTGFQGDGAGSEHTSYEALKDFTLKGNATTSTNPKTGVFCGGANGAAGACIVNVNIEGFGLGLACGANTYHFAWYNGVIRNCAQLININAASNSGEAMHFFNGFFVDPFDATYVTANGVQIADSGAASCLFSGCSFDDTQVRIGQANNVTFQACHFENPGSANWGAYIPVQIDQNLATNVSFNGDTFFNTGTTQFTNYISNGGNVIMNGVIVRKFSGTTITNFMVLTGSGRVTWTGFNNVSTTAITNVVTGLPYTPNGFATAGGAYFTMDNNGHPFYWTTNTAAGTTGAQTINKTSGTVNFAAAATSLVVTNSLVSTSSSIFAVIRTNDTTALIKNVVPGSGSFTITLNAAATAETSVGWWIIN